ncbi:MAG: response regulator transcription factor [Chloroflexi bacterium]|nr:response regulator transcription factor [Chloroflexota bacterium]
MDTISIVLVDDNFTVRRQLALLLGAESDLVILGEGNDGLEGYELVRRLQPDVLIVDVVMPALGGLEVTRRVVQEALCAKVIVLSMYDDEGYVLEALRAGAKGYVLKGDSSYELLHAIREVAEDRHYLSSSLSEGEIEKHVEKARGVTVDPYEMLTFVEREVLLLATEGWDTTEIAAKLSISTRTFEFHRSSIMRKLNVCTDTDLVLFAIRRGLVSPNASLHDYENRHSR